jgi:UDPglucose 6-dehydrogenase
MDLNAERIAGWNDPDLSQRPVIEPSLAEVVGRCLGRPGVHRPQDPYQKP